MLLLDCAGLHARDNMRCVRVYRRVIVKHFGSQLFTRSAVNCCSSLVMCCTSSFVPRVLNHTGLDQYKMLFSPPGMVVPRGLYLLLLRFSLFVLL